MKIAQLTNVDFSLTHFLLPLMRELRARGHEVVGICADGPKLAPAREEGFRIAPIPFARSANPAANLPAFLALLRLFRQERFDLLHVHTPLAGLVGRIAGRIAGIPRIAYTAHGFYFHERMRPSAYRAHVLLERFGKRFTDVLMTQSAEDAETARAERIAPGGAGYGDRQWRRPCPVPPRNGGRARGFPRGDGRGGGRRRRGDDRPDGGREGLPRAVRRALGHAWADARLHRHAARERP
jgi:hypothetical protein